MGKTGGLPMVPVLLQAILSLSLHLGIYGEQLDL